MNSQNRLIILGIDGMDPEIFLYLKEKGEMPNLGAIVEDGNFRFLNTSCPPQSPVSWTCIATGTDAGNHGIYDFLHRNPKTYTPELSLFGIEPYKGAVRYVSHIGIPSIFNSAMERGIKTTLIRWPLTFPAPDSLPLGSRMLCGMGVPDLLGTLGRYLFYTTNETLTKRDLHGRMVLIKPSRQRVKTEIYGPRYRGITGMKESSVEMVLERSEGGLKVVLPETTMNLRYGEWSPHIVIRFSMGITGKVAAVTRMVCIEDEGFPSLFILPLQIYPKETTLPLSSPRSFASELWDEIGPYLSLGMPEDTNGLKDGLITEDIFLALCDEVFSERKRMLESVLRDFDSGILACVFDTLDRIQHMFWRRDVGVTGKGKEARGVIARWYISMDKVVGDILERVGERATLLILSDHGFSPLDKYVHLNTWLVQNGYMSLKDDSKDGGPLFENVNWSGTKAYALGFNSIYINLKDREGKGIIEPHMVNSLCDEIIKGLEGWYDGDKKVIKRVYRGKDIYRAKNDSGPELVVGYNIGYRASKQTILGAAPASLLIEDNDEPWSGDHCCDPSLVPGVLFGVNMDRSLGFPESISVEDIKRVVEQWMDNQSPHHISG